MNELFSLVNFSHDIKEKNSNKTKSNFRIGFFAIIASLMVLSVFGAQDAQAISIVISDEISCETIPDAVWSTSPDTCTITTSQTIESIETWTIGAGVTLTIPGSVSLTVEDEGTIDNFGTIQNNGVIANEGEIINDGYIINAEVFSNSGSITNNGDITIENEGGVLNNDGGIIDNFETIYTGPAGYDVTPGTLSNSEFGQINNNGIITNDGRINNFRVDIDEGFIYNNFIIYSSGEINNYGQLDNSLSGTIENSGTINIDLDGEIYNTGLIENNGTIINVGDEGGGYINNTGGTINNYCGAIFSNDGIFNGNPINYILCSPLYGITGADNDSDFYLLEPGTSGGILIGNSDEALSAIEFDSDGILYAANGPGFASFGTINLTDGLFTEIAPTVTCSDIGIDPTDGTLYCQSKDILYSVVKTNGVATLIGDNLIATSQGSAMDIASDGTMYYGNGIGLYTEDKITGLGTLVYNWVYPFGFDVTGCRTNAFDFDSSGILWASLNCSSGNYLVTIDTDTAKITLVDGTVSDLDGIAFQPTSSNTITINPVPANPKWGIPFEITGTVTGTGDNVEIDWGDTTSSAATLILGNFDATHTYDSTSIGTNTITAYFKDVDDIVATSTPTDVDVQKHTTSISLNLPTSVVASSSVTASGTLTDADTGKQIPLKTISFTGTGASILSSTTTNGVSFASGATPMQLVDCGTCTNPTTLLLGAKILRVFDGTIITFPPNIAEATLLLDGMGTNAFTANVTETGGSSFIVDSAGVAPDIQLIQVALNNGGTIEITSSDLVTGVGISSIKLDDPAADPKNLFNETFDSFETSECVDCTLFLLGGGNYFNTGTTTSDTSIEEPVTAAFAGDANYFGSDASGSYAKESDTLAGVGGSVAFTATPSTGAIYTAIVCGSGNDSDGDNLCNAWEGAGNGVPYTTLFGGTTTNYKYTLTSSNAAVKNVYVEYDSMTGHNLHDTAKTNLESIFSGKGMSLILQNTGDATITHLDNINAWFDTDANRSNDFDSLKGQFFGEPSERPTVTNAGTYSGVSGTPYKLRATAIAITTPAGEFAQGTIIIKERITVSTSATMTLSTPALGFVNGAVTITQGANVATATFTNSGAADLQVNTELSAFGGAASSIVNGAVTIAQGNYQMTATFANTGATGLTANTELSLFVKVVEYGAPTSTTTASGTSRVVVTKIPFATTASKSFILPTIDTSVTPSTGTVAFVVGQMAVTTTKLDAKAQAYHYGLGVHAVGANACNSPTGLAEPLGNDFIVSLGCAPLGESLGSHTGPEGTIEEQTGTFLHELGHNFNLSHGGPAKILVADAYNAVNSVPADKDQNCKPNHISVMNYARQLPQPLGYLTIANWNLVGGYSSGLFSGASLSEKALNEANGLRSSTSATPQIVWAAIARDSTVTPIIIKTGTSTTAAAGTPTAINWDNDGNAAETLAANTDINNFGIIGCQATPTADASTLQLKDYAEWNNLEFNFRTATGAAALDGSHSPAHKTAELTPTITNSITKSLYDSGLFWNMSGFYHPVDMNYVVNTVKGGQSVPLKFEIFEGTPAGTIERTSVLDISKFIQAKLPNCSDFAATPSDAVEITNTGGTSLKYDTTAGQFLANWKTPKMPNTCWVVKVNATNNGESLTAYFKIK